MKIILPSNFLHGISASTSEDPDSFEIHKFVLSANTSPIENRFESHSPEFVQRPAERDLYHSDEVAGGTVTAVKEISDQLDDMSVYIKSMDRVLNSVFSEIAEMKRHGQSKASTMENGLRDVDSRVRSIEQLAKKIRSELDGRDYKDTLAKLQSSVKESQDKLLRLLPGSLSDGTSSPTVEKKANIISCDQIIP